jgi:transmembrane sensor
MDGTPETARRRAFREATDWFILLQEEPGDRDLRRRFDAWREASPLNAEAWAATERASDVATAMTPAHADEWMPVVARRRAQRRTSRWSRRGIGLSLAATALAACIALVAAPSMILRLQSDHVTATAELRELELPDGSRVTLSPASAIALAFGAGERRLRLLEGEAFFEVTPDPTRPFRVEAGKVEASVLGTSFDVRLDAQAVTVAVQEGVVGVVSRNAGSLPAERIEAGQAVRVAAGGRIERSSEPPQLVAAWRKGQLLSHDRPLREAVDQLRRYYAGTIVLTDDALAERTVTGVYNLADPEEALRGIVQAHGGKVRRITPWLLVVSGS